MRKRATVRATPKRTRRAPRTIAGQVPNAIGLVSHHMDYTSHDLSATRRFYTEILGFTRAHHDPGNEYLFITTSATSSLGFMPPLPGPPEEWRPPREPMLYFMVEDVDRVHLELTAKGVVFDQPPTDTAWGHRIARTRDPEGRIVCFAQEIER